MPGCVGSTHGLVSGENALVLYCIGSVTSNDGIEQQLSFVLKYRLVMSTCGLLAVPALKEY
jgi:hypothetical protein